MKVILVTIQNPPPTIKAPTTPNALQAEKIHFDEIKLVHCSVEVHTHAFSAVTTHELGQSNVIKSHAS